MAAFRFEGIKVRAMTSHEIMWSHADFVTALRSLGQKNVTNIVRKKGHGASEQEGRGQDDGVRFKEKPSCGFYLVAGLALSR